MVHRTEDDNHLILKVAAFVVKCALEPMVLAFRHPLAGLQFPAGTIEPGEEILAAAQRAVLEETGISGLDQGQIVAIERCRMDADEGFVVETVESLSDCEGKAVSHFHRGRRIRVLSGDDEFSLVCEEEWNLNVDPPTRRTRIPGIIPTRFIGRSISRAYVRFQFIGDLKTEPWTHASDGHIWQVEWIPLRTTERFAQDQADWFERFTSGLCAGSEIGAVQAQWVTKSI